MSTKSKSIFRGPEAQHFQLVHRSQRDPLVHDSEASQRVLKPIIKDNDLRKGKSLNDLESHIRNIGNDKLNMGEAAEYGILFDDTEYDYMQHLRDTTLKDEKGIESIFVSASLPISKTKSFKVKYSDTFELKLPPDVLPSVEELDPAKALEAQRDIPDEIAGFHPDLNPHLRQVLKALHEDAFVEDSLDDFFGDLVEGGERDIGDEDFKFYEDGGETLDDITNIGEGEESWEAKFAQFKKRHGMKALDDHEDSDSLFCTHDINAMSQTESLDTLGNLPVLIDKKRRRRGAAYITSSGFSMTSSAVYRNPGLTLLDERFEQFDKTYDDDIPSGPEDLINSDPDVAPDLIAARNDFETAMDDFLQNYEVIGRRMRATLRGTTGVDKLDIIPRAMKKFDISKNAENEIADGDGDTSVLSNLDEEKERWDCETILSTYSNLENHPRLIRVRNTKRMPQVKVDLKKGILVTSSSERKALLEDLEKEEEDTQNSDATEQHRATITRPRNELKGEKKARKLAMKKERQARRQDKKANQEVFSKEWKQLAKVMINKGDIKVNKL